MITDAYLFITLIAIIAIPCLYKVWFNKNFESHDKFLVTIIGMPMVSILGAFIIFFNIRFLDSNTTQSYNFMPKQVTRDNKNSYNTRNGGEQNSIRVPSLKRSDKVWRNFYNLFPSLKGRTTYRGCKLKKV